MPRGLLLDVWQLTLPCWGPGETGCHLSLASFLCPVGSLYSGDTGCTAGGLYHCGSSGHHSQPQAAGPRPPHQVLFESGMGRVVRLHLEPFLLPWESIDQGYGRHTCALQPPHSMEKNIETKKYEKAFTGGVSSSNRAAVEAPAASIF